MNDNNRLVYLALFVVALVLAAVFILITDRFAIRITDLEVVVRNLIARVANIEGRQDRRDRD